MIPKTIQQKLDEGRQYRSVVEIRAVDEEMIVEGYATTFNTPYTLYEDNDFRIDEQVDSRAFDNADMSDVIMQYDHEGRVFARKSNGTLALEADAHGLHIRADLGGTELGRQLYEEIRGGYTDKMSFGFTVGKQERTEEIVDGKTIVHRKITGIKKLYDVSAVSLPANDATEISARKFGEGVIREIEEERLAMEARRKKAQRIKIIMEMEDTPNEKH